MSVCVVCVCVCVCAILFSMLLTCSLQNLCMLPQVESQCVVVGSNTQCVLQIYALLDNHLLPAGHVVSQSVFLSVCQSVCPCVCGHLLLAVSVSVCVCVCVCEREREIVCVTMCVCVRVHPCV